MPSTSLMVDRNRGKESFGESLCQGAAASVPSYLQPSGVRRRPRPSSLAWVYGKERHHPHQTERSGLWPIVNGDFPVEVSPLQAKGV